VAESATARQRHEEWPLRLAGLLFILKAGGRMKAAISLEIDELGLEARVTLSPSERAPEVSREAVMAQLHGKGVRQGIIVEELDRALRLLSRKPGEPVRFIAARGEAPLPAEPQIFAFEPLVVPAHLGAFAQALLAQAPPPEVYRVSERRVQKKRKLLKKPALPFLPPKEVIETVVVKENLREKVAVDPTVRSFGYVRKEAVVARVRPGSQGRAGRSIYGRAVPAPRRRDAELFLGAGVARAGQEIHALASGFLRRGEGWCDLVAFQDQEAVVAASSDKSSCFLSFTPGDKRIPLLQASEVIAQAAALGVPRERLLPPAEIQRRIEEAAAKGVPIAKVPMTPSADASVSIQVSPDRLRATLCVRKGKGGGRKLSLQDLGNAVRASGVRAFDAEVVKKDLAAFYSSSQEELKEYLLAEGKPPGAGKGGRLEWQVKFAGPEQTRRVREQALSARSRLAALRSLADFPLEEVQAVARVQAGQEVVRVFPGTAGETGMDVYKMLIPGARGAEPELRLFEGLKRQKGAVIAEAAGLLERSDRPGTVLLRVRQHRDAELQVSLSPDRMQARVSFFPAEGSGRALAAEELKTQLAQAGVRRGLDPVGFAQLAGAAQSGQVLKDLLVAKGKPPKPAPARQLAFHVRLASGSSVTVSADGRADFRNQDKLTSVRRGELLATQGPPGRGAEEGWDVSGTIIPAPPQKQESVAGGKGVRSSPLPDGGMQFFADTDGELFLEANLLEVKPVHAIPGDIGLESGNVKFSGAVQIQGSVLSGFRVEAGDDVLVEQTVQAADVSSAGGITIRQGIKGEGRARLSAARSVNALFAEQASIRAGGDVRIRNACVRCRVRCNGKLTLDTDKGNLIGGRAQARRGLAVQNLGSPSGTRTEVSFGQDYLLLEKIEQAQAEAARLSGKLSELKQRVRFLERPGSDRKELELAVAERRETQNAAEDGARRLAALQEQFKQGCPAEVEVRGVLYPGVVLESHGRTYAPTVEKHRIRLRYDERQRQIVEKP
jgi:uncharacterized protein (DUF342 family)